MKARSFVSLCLTTSLLALSAVVHSVRGDAPQAPAGEHAGHAEHAAVHLDHGGATAPHAEHAAALRRSDYSAATRRYAAPDVELLDATGAPVRLREVLEAEEPVALNFIFTTCTTICPVMSATFAHARHELGADAERVRWVSVSIDPEFDRPEVLSAYAARFDAAPDWRFLTGESADVQSTLVAFDVYAGSKMNHRPVTLLKPRGGSQWLRIEGLVSGSDLAREIAANILD